MRRKTKIAAVLFLLLSAIVFFQLITVTMYDSYKDRVLFGYSENAEVVAIHFQPTANENFDALVKKLKVILDENHANLYTRPNRDMGVYITDDSIWLNKNDRDMLNQLDKNKIMVLQNSIMDKYSSELIVYNYGVEENQLDFNNPQFKFSSDYSLAVEGVEYLYNFFDLPYFNGYFIIDSQVNADAPAKVVDFFAQNGFYSYVQYDDLAYDNNFLRFVYESYTKSPKFMIIPLLLILYICNSIVIVNHILRQENEGILIRNYFGASFISQFLKIVRHIIVPLVAAVGSWILIIALFNHYWQLTMGNYGLIFIMSVSYTMIIFLIVFAFQYAALKIKQKMGGKEI